MPRNGSVSVASLSEDHLTFEVDGALKRWGFKHHRMGRDHRELVDANRKIMVLPKKKTQAVNVHQMKEILNYLGLRTEEEFFQGPPETPPVPAEPIAAESPNGSAAAEVPAAPAEEAAPPAVPESGSLGPVGKTRRTMIEFLDRSGGEVRSDKGMVAVALAQALGLTAGAIGQQLGEMEKAGQILKDKVDPKSGQEQLRRLYGVVLCYDNVTVRAVTNRTAPPEATAPVVLPERPPPPPPPEPEVAEEVVDEPVVDLAALVVDELLGRIPLREIAVAVVDELGRRLTAPSREAHLREQIADLGHKLAHAVEYGQRLRKERGELEEEVIDLRRHRGGG